MRRPSEKNGFIRVYTKASERGLQFRLEEYEPFIEAWESGRAFFRGLDCFGDPIHVRLGDVSSVTVATPASIAAYDEEYDAMRLAGGE